MVRICPNCLNYGSQAGVSAFCVLSGRIARKGNPRHFAGRFKEYVGFVVAGWLLPPIGGGILLVQTYDNALLLSYNAFMLASFSIQAFYLAPNASGLGCQGCRMKRLCPWKGERRPGHAAANQS